MPKQEDMQHHFVCARGLRRHGGLHDRSDTRRTRERRAAGQVSRS